MPFQERIFILIFVVSLLLTIGVVLLSIICYRLWKQKAELEQQLILSRLNPHFVFNSLTAIQSYILKNDSHFAGKFLSNYSKLLRLILDNSSQKYISISADSNTLCNYLELQVLRFEGQLKYVINIDQSIDSERFNVPPMLVFPYVEAIIDHGYINISGECTICVNYGLENNKYIVIDVRDISSVVDDKHENQIRVCANYKSDTIEKIRERLLKIRRIYGLKILMDFADSSKQNGEKRSTSLCLKIPVKKCIQL